MKLESKTVERAKSLVCWHSLVKESSVSSVCVLTAKWHLVWRARIAPPWQQKQ